MISAARSRKWLACLRAAAALLCLPIAGAVFLAEVEAAHSLPVGTAVAANTRDVSAHESECLTCHRDLAEHYHDTAHARTSRPAGPNSVLGYVESGRNDLVVRDVTAPDGMFSFRVVKRAGKFRQSVVRERAGIKDFRSESIDEVIGSGKRGQTYLYWRGDFLFELPLSWWRDGNMWINSPGYPDGTANFSRPVITRCLECHADNIQALSPAALNSHFDRSSFSYGVGCVRCHGDGNEHTAAERNAVAHGAARAPASRILNPRNFARDRQIDLCALCHSGQREQLQPAFTYRAGEPLDRFLRPSTLSAVPDVHGNQVGLLERSSCYRNSSGMTCSTCHEVHAPEQPVASYNSRCLVCHKAKSCGKFAALGGVIVNRCIDCHMPIEAAQSIVSQTAGETARAQIRTHWIRVYSP